MVSVADFMAQARELLRAGPNTKSLHQVGILLAEASAKPGFIPEVEMHRLHGGDSTFTVLQTDPDYRLAARIPYGGGAGYYYLWVKR